MLRFLTLSENTLPALTLLVLIFAVAITSLANAAERAIIVFDGSGSMWGQVNGINKIVTARETLARVLPTFPQTMDLGLLAYGHNKKGDCSDIQMLVTPGPVSQTAGAISTAVGALNPKGKTPLTDAVRRAAGELRYTESKATVILITDGLETCEADPCALASELERSGLDFTTHVIGFGLTEEEGRQVACLADNTGGRYIPASDATTLGNALTQTVTVAPASLPQPVEPQRERPKFNLIASASLGANNPPFVSADKFKFDWKLEPTVTAVGGNPPPAIGRLTMARVFYEPGSYMLTARYGDDVFGSIIVNLREFEAQEFVVPLNAGLIEATAVPLNTKIDLTANKFRWSVRNVATGKSFIGFSNEIRQIVPPGDYEITFFPGKVDRVMLPPLQLRVDVGQIAQGTKVAPVSRVVLNGYAPNGRALSDKEVFYKIFDGPVARENQITDVWGPRPIYLLPGRYNVLIEYRLNGERIPVEASFDVGEAEDLAFDFRYSQ